MEKYTQDEARNEAEKIRQEARAQSGYTGEPHRDDYENAHRLLEEAKETRRNLKNIDLSTQEGRMAVRNMCWMQRHFPDMNRTQGRLESAILESLPNQPGIIPIDEERILENLMPIVSFYGHEYQKRRYELEPILIEGGLDENPREVAMLNGSDEEIASVLFANIFSASANVSSESLNRSASGHMLIKLAEAMRSGKVNPEDVKSHPNYQSLVELVMKSDRQQTVLTDILFKIYSGYINSGKIKIPPVPFSVNEKNSIFEKTKEAEDLHQTYLRRGDTIGAISQDLTYSEIDESVSSLTENAKLETEFKGWATYIDLFQPILEKYNASMSYDKPLGKNGSAN